MSYFQNQDINSQSKFDKTVFLKKNKTSSMFCGDCSFFSQEDNILRKNMAEPSANVKKTLQNKQKKTLQRFKKKSLKIASKNVQLLQNTMPCSPNNMIEYHKISILSDNFPSRLVRTIQFRNKQYFELANTQKPCLSYQKPCLSYQKPFQSYLNQSFSRISALNFRNSAQSIKIDSSLRTYESLTNNFARINFNYSRKIENEFTIPMIKSINREQIQSSSSLSRKQIVNLKLLPQKNRFMSKIKFIYSVSGNLSDLPISPVKQISIEEHSQPSGMNSGRKSCQDQKTNLIIKLRSPPNLNKYNSVQESQVSQDLILRVSMPFKNQQSIEPLSKLSADPSEHLQGQIQQNVQIKDKAMHAFGRHSVEIPPSKQLSGFIVRKTISLRDQQSSSQDETSQVIYGFRKTNKMPVMQDIAEDLQDSMMTKIQQKIERSNENFFHNF